MVFTMNAEKIYYGGILFCLVAGVIVFLITHAIMERKERKYEKELLRRSMISFLEIRLKGKAKDIAISDLAELKSMEEELIKIQEKYNSSTRNEVKESLRYDLKQNANYMLEFCKQLKNEYRFILNKEGKQYLNEQMSFCKRSITSCK